MFKLKNYMSYLVLFGIMLFMVACSNTPNNVSMSLNQGQCAQPSQYSSSQLSNLQTTYESYYNLLINNPSTTTPYCTSVTVQNNNSGLNANSVQITSSGLQVSTILPGTTTTTSATLYDSSASGVTIGGLSQNINNIILFDPNNCTTTTGANVKTLSAGGGSCTFYLEILNEANPVGVYPYYITYNYTNGNQNYNANSTLNQRVYLYGGDYSSPGVYYVEDNVVTTGSDESTAAAWQNGLTGSPPIAVTYVTANAYGAVYFAAGSSVYSYNGISISQVGNNLPASVSSIAFDSYSNIYAAINNLGMWVYNVTAATPSWEQVTDSRGSITSTSNIIGLKGESNTIYAFSESQVYNCTVNGTPSESCSKPSSTGQPRGFFTNSADVDSFGNLYIGSSNSNNTLGISILSIGNLWFGFTESPVIESSGNSIGGVRFTNSALYFGVVGSSESSVYNCGSSNCGPTVSSSRAPMTGNATTVTTDGGSNLYVAGYNLNSTDYGTSTLTTGAFLLTGSYAASGVGTWQTISNTTTNTASVPTNVSSITVASMLTSY